MAEAETGARTLRERAADDLAAAQLEAHTLRRQSRAETTTLLTSARAEADQLRTEARQQLTAARNEVHALSQRRTQIESELGQLSGVIEALAVPEHGDDPGHADDPEHADDLHPSQPANLR